MSICFRVELSEAERGELQTMLGGGKHAARKLKRVQILLAADAGLPDETIASSLAVGGSTVYRTKRRFVEGNLARALNQGERMNGRSCGLADEGLEVASVPAGALPAVLQAGRGLGLMQQAHGHVLDHGHVLGPVAGP